MSSALLLSYVPENRHNRLYPGKFARPEQRNAFLLAFVGWIHQIVWMRARKTHEDSFQEAFLFALQAYPKYRPEQGKFTTFLFKHCLGGIARVRKQKKARETAISENHEIAERSLPCQCEFNAHLADRMTSFTERERFIIYRRLEGYTLEEIGQELNLTKSAVSLIEQRCLNHLRKTW